MNAVPVRCGSAYKLRGCWQGFTCQSSLRVLRLLGDYFFRPYSSAYVEALTSAASVRRRLQTGVKPGSSFVQDGLFVVLVVAAIW
jgi:hypothetical protein